MTTPLPPAAPGLWPLIITGAAGGLVPLAVAFMSYRQAKEANRQTRFLENRKADREAFIAAQQIYKDAIATLEAQLRSARERITELERRQNQMEADRGGYIPRQDP
jgi:biopolymer transport protein ExbB/TolQ